MNYGKIVLMLLLLNIGGAILEFITFGLIGLGTTTTLAMPGQFSAYLISQYILSIILITGAYKIYTPKLGDIGMSIYYLACCGLIIWLTSFFGILISIVWAVLFPVPIVLLAIGSALSKTGKIRWRKIIPIYKEKEARGK